MRCCANADPAPARAARAWLRLLTLLAAALLAWCRPAFADGITVQSAELRPAENSYQLSAEFDVRFGDHLKEALTHGIPLQFIVEFELIEPHRWWLDSHVATASTAMRVSYQALTRQYVLATPAGQRSFNTLEEARLALGRAVQDWPVFERARVKPRHVYSAAVRMRLDNAQLPKPIQLYALANSDWVRESDWRRFALTP